MQQHQAISKVIQQINGIYDNADLFILVSSQANPEQGFDWYLEIGFLTYFTEVADDEHLIGEPCEYWIWRAYVSETEIDQISDNYAPDEHPWW